MTLQRSQIKQVMLWPRRVWNMIAWKAIGKIGHYGRIYMHYLISPVFQSRGHDLLSDLRSPNKKISDIHIVIGHVHISHAKFRIHCSKTVGHSKGQVNMQLFSWHNLVTWPDLTLAWKFHQRRKINQTEATNDFVALRLAVSLAICEKPHAVVYFNPPLATALVKTQNFNF